MNLFYDTTIGFWKHFEIESLFEENYHSHVLSSIQVYWQGVSSEAIVCVHNLIFLSRRAESHITKLFKEKQWAYWFFLWCEALLDVPLLFFNWPLWSSKNTHLFCPSLFLSWFKNEWTLTAASLHYILKPSKPIIIISKDSPANLNFLQLFSYVVTSALLLSCFSISNAVRLSPTTACWKPIHCPLFHLTWYIGQTECKKTDIFFVNYILVIFYTHYYTYIKSISLSSWDKHAVMSTLHSISTSITTKHFYDDGPPSPCLPKHQTNHRHRHH